jgi:hypothetical protein
VNRLSVLREELAASGGPEPGGRSRRGKRIAPQDAFFDRAWKNGEYCRLFFRVTVMEHLHGMLTNEESLLLNLVLEELPWAQIAAAMNLAEETCKKRKWPKIVVKAAGLFFGDLAS